MNHSKKTADIDLSTVDLSSIPLMSKSERESVLKAIIRRASEVRDFSNEFLSQVGLTEAQINAIGRS